MPGLNPGTFAAWQPASPHHASSSSSSSSLLHSSGLGSPGFLERATTSNYQGGAGARPHPVGILHSQMAGYLASGFKQVVVNRAPTMFFL